MTNCQPLHWPDAFEGAQSLTQKLKARYPVTRLPCYVLVGRGGLAVGAMMARFMDMERILYLPFSRYDRVRMSNCTKPFRYQNIGPLRAASHVFLIDDIYDEGITLQTIARELVEGGAVDMPIAITLLNRSPNYFRGEQIVWRTINHEDWVVFPWEVYDPPSLERKEIPL